MFIHSFTLATTLSDYLTYSAHSYFGTFPVMFERGQSLSDLMLWRICLDCCSSLAVTMRLDLLLSFPFSILEDSVILPYIFGCNEKKDIMREEEGEQGDGWTMVVSQRSKFGRVGKKTKHSSSQIFRRISASSKGCEGLEKKLDTIWIGTFKLWVNVRRFAPRDRKVTRLKMQRLARLPSKVVVKEEMLKHSEKVGQMVKGQREAKKQKIQPKLACCAKQSPTRKEMATVIVDLKKDNMELLSDLIYGILDWVGIGHMGSINAVFSSTWKMDANQEEEVLNANRNATFFDSQDVHDIATVVHARSDEVMMDYFAVEKPSVLEMREMGLEDQYVRQRDYFKKYLQKAIKARSLGDEVVDRVRHEEWGLGEERVAKEEDFVEVEVEYQSNLCEGKGGR
ncbi:hypothetical protein VNO78_25094 [Psophocarpus tetragonolobus]|uniref:Uncharacterized protein n=1 Tax=Psophocarpus tetragonolobus TaxID=3891 RepID=A0AAN9S5B1_PSOTE